MSSVTNLLSSCWSTLTSCFPCCGGQEEDDSHELLLLNQDRPPELTASNAIVMEEEFIPDQTNNISLIDRVQEIDLESEESVPHRLQTEAQVLEGAPSSFYIGVKTPKEVVAQGITALPEDIAKDATFLKHPHMTLTPPNKSLHPEKSLQEVETISQPLDVVFTQITITPRGNINMLGEKTKEYDAFTEALATAHDGKPTERDPHSIIGRLDEQTVKAMFQDPEKYGFTFDKSRNILVKNIEEPISFQVTLPQQRPHEQRLLALSYGEDVFYAKEPLTRDLKLEAQFHERQELVLKEKARAIAIFAGGGIPKCPHYNNPVHFTAIALDLAANGHKEYGRIPLTFSMKAPDLNEGVQMWVAFRGEVSTTLVGHSYDDSHVSLLGSGVTGYSGNPHKPMKAWTPNSDVDCAIFSTKLASEHLEKNGWVNTKVSMMGKYAVFKNDNNPKESKTGFYELPVGQKLEALSLKWTKILYGEPDTQKPKLEGRDVEWIKEDEIDFKLNIGDVPFKGSAITFFALDHAQTK